MILAPETPLTSNEYQDENSACWKYLLAAVARPLTRPLPRPLQLDLLVAVGEWQQAGHTDYEMSYMTQVKPLLPKILFLAPLSASIPAPAPDTLKMTFLELSISRYFFSYIDAWIVIIKFAKTSWATMIFSYNIFSSLWHKKFNIMPILQRPRNQTNRMENGIRIQTGRTWSSPFCCAGHGFFEWNTGSSIPWRRQGTTTTTIVWIPLSLTNTARK